MSGSSKTAQKLEECRAAGKYRVDFAVKHYGRRIRECGKDWLLWCVGRSWIQTERPESWRAVKMYLEYLDAYPGKCVIEDGWGLYDGHTIETCDVSFVNAFSYKHAHMKKTFPAVYEAGRAWIQALSRQLLDTQPPWTMPEGTDPGEVVSSYLSHIQRQHLLSQAANDIDLPDAPPKTRQYTAIRDIGEPTRSPTQRLLKELEADSGEENHYQYDDGFLVHDSDVLDDDVRSEITDFYVSEIGEGVTSKLRPSMTNPGALRSQEKLEKTPKQRKRAIRPSTDSESDHFLSTNVPKTSSSRRPRTLALKDGVIASGARQLPTPLPTPRGPDVSSSSGRGPPRTPRRTSSKLSKTSRKRRARDDSTSGDDNDDEPLAERLTRSSRVRRDSGDDNDDEPLSKGSMRSNSARRPPLKKTSVTRKVPLPSPTPCLDGSEDDEPGSALDDFILDDTPTRVRKPRSPNTSRRNPFIRG